jgi:hypothetical protein
MCPRFWAIQNTRTVEARKSAVIARFSASRSCPSDWHYGSNPNRMCGFNFRYRSPGSSAIDWGGRPEKIRSVTRVFRVTGGIECPTNRKSIILTGELSDAFMAPSSSAEKTDRFAVSRIKSSGVVRTLDQVRLAERISADFRRRIELHGGAEIIDSAINNVICWFAKSF